MGRLNTYMGLARGMLLMFSLEGLVPRQSIFVSGSRNKIWISLNYISLCYSDASSLLATRFICREYTPHCFMFRSQYCVVCMRGWSCAVSYFCWVKFQCSYWTASGYGNFTRMDRWCLRVVIEHHCCLKFYWLWAWILDVMSCGI